jgi:Dullard-like phosphatase family protein
MKGVFKQCNYETLVNAGNLQNDECESLPKKLECVNLGEFFALFSEGEDISLKIYGEEVDDEKEMTSSQFEINNLPPNCENSELNSNLCDDKGQTFTFKALENLNIEFDFVESSLNFKGNYHNYVSRVLKSLVPIRFINYSNILKENKIILPESNNNKKTLILDLDETLIHSDFDYNYQFHDHLITFRYEGQDVEIPIILRPGLFEFLENISGLFEVFIFTASKREYADVVLDFLDPFNKIFKQRFYREHCISINNRIFLKDLRVFANRKPENIIIVDNSLYSFSNQLSNGILINSFYDDKDDRELLNLFNYLQEYIRNAADSRAVNEKVFNFNLIFEEFADLHYNNYFNIQ